MHSWLLIDADDSPFPLNGKLVTAIKLRDFHGNTGARVRAPRVRAPPYMVPIGIAKSPYVNPSGLLTLYIHYIFLNSRRWPDPNVLVISVL